MERKSNIKKWITLALCCVTASLIFKLPYLRETYYAAMQEATGATNAQLGMLMSIYGIFSFMLYIPSGWAADRFSARNLMVFSLISTGITGFYYATFPSFKVILLLHALWAFTTTFTFWAICVRIIRELGERAEQGKLYGFWYLGKGITSMIVGFISVPLFSGFGEGVGGLRSTIVFYSALILVSGIISWFVVDESKIKSGINDEKSNFSIADMKVVFRLPTIWVAGIIPFCMWSIYIGFGMVTPYLTNILKMGESQTAVASILRAYVLLAIGGLIGGRLADKFVSRTRFMIYVFSGMVLFTIGFIILPGNTSMLMAALINMAALGGCIYCANAVFFSLIDEIDIPERVTGTAVGVMSLLAYFPEIYCYTMVGDMVDKHPGIEGYRMVFIFMLVCAVIGLAASFTLQAINKKQRL